MDSEVTNPKYEIIWTNSSSDNDFFVCSVYDPTPQPEFGLYHISRKIFHLHLVYINFSHRIQICTQKRPKILRKNQ